MMNKYISKITILLLCVFLSSCATFTKSGDYYRNACRQVKRQNYAMAFMNLRALLNNDPQSRYAPMAAFAVGEYYFDKNDYLDAAVAFRKYIKDYPNDSGTIFAEMIIYKMTTQVTPNKNIPSRERYLLEGIRKKMFAKPLFFIFTENKKTYSYRSIFGNVYTAFDYVDKVEVKRNDKLLFKLSP